MGSGHALVVSLDLVFEQDRVRAANGGFARGVRLRHAPRISTRHRAISPLLQVGHLIRVGADFGLESARRDRSSAALRRRVVRPGLVELDRGAKVAVEHGQKRFEVGKGRRHHGVVEYDLRGYGRVDETKRLIGRIKVFSEELEAVRDRDDHG